MAAFAVVEVVKDAEGAFATARFPLDRKRSSFMPPSLRYRAPVIASGDGDGWYDCGQGREDGSQAIITLRSTSSRALRIEHLGS